MSLDSSLWRLIADASVVVQLVMLLLLAASILSWVLIVVKTRVFRAAEQAAERFEARFWSGDTELSQLYQALRKRTQAGQGLERVFVAGYREFARLPQPAPGQQEMQTQVAARAMQVVAHRETDALDRYLFILASIASVSPFVGLFGTVWGIMNAFRALSEVQTATLSMVAPGIAEALIATAMGLVAAIPAAVAYNHFVDKLERLSQRFEDFAQQFTNLLQAQWLRAGSAAQAR